MSTTKTLEPVKTENTISKELAKVNVSDKLIAELRTRLDLTITDVNDKKGYQAVDAARKECKQWRVLVTNTCKLGREEAVRIQKEWIAKEKEIGGQIEAIEDELAARTKVIDDEKARIAAEELQRRNELIKSRVDQLIKSGCSFDGLVYTVGLLEPTPMQGIAEVAEDVFASRIAMYKEEADRIEAELQAARDEAERIAKEIEQAERDRIAAEQKKMDEERAELERLRKEQERIANEQKVRENKIEAESKELQKKMVNARSAELSGLGMRFNGEEHVYEDIEVNAFDLEASTNSAWAKIIEKVSAEICDRRAMAAEKAERIAREQKEAEEKRHLQEIEDAKEAVRLENIEAERKAKEQYEAEQLEIARAELLRPDREKLLAFSNSLNDLKYPELSTDSSLQLLADVKSLVAKIQKHIHTKTKELQPSMSKAA